MTKPYLMYIDPENESAGLKIEWRTHKGPGTIAQLSSELADQHPDDLDVTTITDEEGFKQTVVTLNEARKSQRIAAENQAKQEREQKETERRSAMEKARKDLASAKAPTGQPKVKWRVKPEFVSRQEFDALQLKVDALVALLSDH